MMSHEVIREAVKEPGVKQVAAALKVSSGLVYKWCEPPASADPDNSGARNPLDRTRLLYQQTKDIRLIRYLCNAAGGFFVANTVGEDRQRPEAQIFGETARMFNDFNNVITAITESQENDPYIDADEAEVIRDTWEELKSVLEQFVTACEAGHYHVDHDKVDLEDA